MCAISGMTSGIIIAGLLGGLLAIASPAQAQAQSNAAVRCASNDGHYARCSVPWRRVALYKQESKGACIEGHSWGMDHGTLWVDRGCRGLFGPAGRGDNRNDNRHGERNNNRNDNRHGQWQPGPDWNRRITLRCDSNSNKYQMCQVDVGRNGSVRLGRQISDNRCTKGYSWGWNRAGVWTAHGCRGEFLVDRRW